MQPNILPNIPLNELIAEIEAAGYVMTGDRMFSQFPRRLHEGRVLRAPLVLIPNEPPVQAECVMIPDILSEPHELRGYARIEGAAMLDNGTVVRLQFVKVLVVREQ